MHMSKGKWPFRLSAATRAVKAFEKAGKIVTSARICSATGDIMLTFGESEAADVGGNEWDLALGLTDDGSSNAVR
jgi:hypothetical protein